MKLLSAMGGINDRIEKHNHAAETDDEESGKVARGTTGIKEVDGLYAKLEGLEQGEKRLHKETEALQKELLELTTKYKKSVVSGAISMCLRWKLTNRPRTSQSWPTSSTLWSISNSPKSLKPN